MNYQELSNAELNRLIAKRTGRTVIWPRFADITDAALGLLDDSSSDYRLTRYLTPGNTRHWMVEIEDNYLGVDEDLPRAICIAWLKQYDAKR